MACLRYSIPLQPAFLDSLGCKASAQIDQDLGGNQLLGYRHLRMRRHADWYAAMAQVGVQRTLGDTEAFGDLFSAEFPFAIERFRSACGRLGFSRQPPTSMRRSKQ
jgi:hypothetical protein